MVRYFRLVTDAADLRLEQEGEAYRFEVGYAGGVEPAKESIDAFISLLLRFCRSPLGRHYSPLRVALRRPRPGQVERYEAMLTCPSGVGVGRNSGGFVRVAFVQATPEPRPEPDRPKQET